MSKSLHEELSISSIPYSLSENIVVNLNN